jgi:hypothetical protein
MQPSNSDPSSYDLSFSDNSEKYSYNGVRTSDNGQFVLIFDESNKRFVLHRVDSTFNMNLVKAPWEDDASTLRSQYPQLESEAMNEPQQSQKKMPKSGKNATTAKATAKAEPKRKKAAEKPKKAKPPPREPTPDEDEDDSDDGFTIEIPDAPQASQTYKPTPVFQRQVSEEVSDEDAEGEEYEDERNQDVDHLKLPSPANNAGGMSDEDLELDLEAELEEALRETAGTGAESDESEED